MSTQDILTSPIINGTPSGDGVPIIIRKRGSGTGTNYTSSSITNVDVDSTNLTHTVVVPIGWTLTIQASGSIFVATAVVNVAAVIVDNGAVLSDRIVQPTVINTLQSFALIGYAEGDGGPHNIRLQYRTSNAANSVGIYNGSLAASPLMLIRLEPSSNA